MYKITYFDHQGSWSFDIFTEKKYMCFLHKPIAVSLEFSSQITLNFKIICWLCSATKKSLSGSVLWMSWFNLMDYIPFSRFYTPLGNEIEAETSSFKNAGVRPFLIQEAGKWSDTSFLRTFLTLSTWGDTIFSFPIHFSFHFHIELQVFCFGSWSFGPSESQSLSEWRERLVLLFLLFQKPWFGACVHTGSVSACSDAVFLRGGDLIVTKVAAKRRNSVN